MRRLFFFYTSKNETQKEINNLKIQIKRNNFLIKHHIAIIFTLYIHLLLHFKSNFKTTIYDNRCSKRN